MEENEAKLIEKQEQDNNIINADENIPLKNDDTVFQSVIKNINHTLKGDDNKEDDKNKDNNKGNEKEEYPIKLWLEGRQDSIIIIKSKLLSPWAHHFKEKWYNLGIKFLFYIALPFFVSLTIFSTFCFDNSIFIFSRL